MSKWESSLGQTDEWYTPRYIFDALEVDYFDVDVAAPNDRTFCHVPAKKFITSDSLNQQLSGYVWMNPPFGGRNGIGPWLSFDHVIHIKPRRIGMTAAIKAKFPMFPNEFGKP